MQINKNFMAFGPLNVSEVGVARGQWAGGIRRASVCVRLNSQQWVRWQGATGKGEWRDVVWRAYKF